MITSLLGFGAAPIGNLYKEVSDSCAFETLDTAWTGGIRRFDTAPFYGFGLSERRLGHFLSTVDRHEAIISTKVGRVLCSTEQKGPRLQQGYWTDGSLDAQFDYSGDAIEKSFSESLERLGLDRVDTLYVHDLGEKTHGDKSQEYWDQFVSSGLDVLRQLKQDGKVRVVGIGANEPEVCVRMIEELSIDAVLIAGRYTLLDQSASVKLLPLAGGRDVEVTLAGVYNSGILAMDGAQGHYDYGMADADVRERTTRIDRLCSGMGLKKRDVALQFALNCPNVKSVVVGFSTPDEVRSALDAATLEIDESVWRELEKLP